MAADDEVTNVDTLRTRGGRWVSHGVAMLADAALCTLVALVGWVVVAALLGLSPVVVSSGSMAPLLRTGDVLLNGTPGTDTLGPGTVVTYEAGPPPVAMGYDAGSSIETRLISHRIVASGPDGYTTRGDANRDVDRGTVPHGAVVGVGRLVVPYVGLPAVWLREGAWATLALLAIGAWAIASQSTVLGAASRSTVLGAASQARARHRDHLDVDVADTPDDAGLDDDRVADLEVTETPDRRGHDGGADLGAGFEGPDDGEPLWPEAPEEPVTAADDGEPLWPELDPDAVRAAARAADAALRAGRTLRSLDELSDDVEQEVEAGDHALTRAVARITDLHGRARGSGAIIVLALALVLGATLGPAPSTAASFVAASSAPDNRFATAALPTVAPLVVVLPAVGGGTTVTSGNGNQNSTTTSTTTVTQATRVQGPARVIARVSNTQGGNVSRDVEVTVRIDGQVVATGARTGLPSMPSWTDVTVDLGTVDRVVPAGAVVTVTVELQRLQLQVGGPTVVTLGTS